MFHFSSNAKIFVYSDPTNMRKSFEGLSQIVEEKFSKNICEDAFYVFINRKKDCMKVLYWDQDGLAIWYKRLEKGNFLQNPKTELCRREFIMLLEGITPKKLNRRYSLN
jgi:transposase